MFKKVVPLLECLLFFETSTQTISHSELSYRGLEHLGDCKFLERRYYAGVSFFMRYLTGPLACLTGQIAIGPAPLLDCHTPLDGILRLDTQIRKSPTDMENKFIIQDPPKEGPSLSGGKEGKGKGGDFPGWRANLWSSV